MIVARLMGGLGNQMFQYAAARALALRHDVELRLDLFYLGTQHHGMTIREFGLDCFALDPQFARKRDLQWIRYPAAGSSQMLKSRIKTILRPSQLVLVQQEVLGFDSRIERAPGNALLVGHWQSEEYFRDHAAEIRRDFAFRTPPSAENERLAEEIRDVTAVSVHVRRADYVTDAQTERFHGVLPPAYYDAAVAAVAERVGDPHFFVFSDDPDWARAHIRPRHPVTYVSHNGSERAHEDLRMMSLCDHHIVANSSFSWWGAWLNTDPGKTVVAPLRWFRDPGLEVRALLPPAWIRL